MTELLVREIIRWSDEEALGLLPAQHTVVFDDGEKLQACKHETLYSFYFWKIFRTYGQTRILKKHHVKSVLKGKSLNTDTHTKLCSVIFRSIVEDEHLFLPAQKEPALKLIYATISDAMTTLSLATEECPTSIDILDFIQIARHERIEELRAAAIRDPLTIKYAYDETIRIIETEPEFHDNGLAKAMRAKMVKANQVVQCVMLRGFPTEVDGAIFSRPITSNYTFGNTSLYDFVADSRTAAKSHYYSDTALKDSEYMARKFQLFTTTVERVAYEDCGSQRHILWQVQGVKYDKAGAIIYPGDLPFLVGKWYQEEGSEEYRWIEGHEDHLVGKKIKLRSVMYCNHSDPHAVCHVCVGMLSENISRFANIGHLGGVMTTKDLTQSILSIKHVNTSSTMVKIFLNDHERKFMNTGTDGAGFYLNEGLKSTSPTLTIIGKEAAGLVDLELVDDIDRISLARMSETTEVLLTTVTGGRTIETKLDVRQRTKPSMMSRELLHYLKVNGWKTNEQNNFVFDLDRWDYKWPLFTMPNKEESFVDLATAVDSLVRSSQKALKKRLIKDSPAILLQELFEMINSKLQINILNLEIIVYALMIEKHGNYALARNAPDPILGVGDTVIYNRSLGPAMAYEGQNELLTNPASFFQGKRPDNPMDVFLAPKEVVDEYQHK